MLKLDYLNFNLRLYIYDPFKNRLNFKQYIYNFNSKFDSELNNN